MTDPLQGGPPLESDILDALPRLTLAAFLTDIRRRHGDGGSPEALVFEGRRVGYGELEAESRRYARALVAAGLGKGSRVAVLLSNRPEWIYAWFATGIIGGVFIPISTYAKREERDYVLRHSDACLLLAQERLLSHRYLAELTDVHPELRKPPPLRCPALPQLRQIVAIDAAEPRTGSQSLGAFLAAGQDVPDAVLDAMAEEVAPADDALLIYTSGTTARPKAVLHRQRAALINGLRFSRWMALDATDRVYSAQPFFWTAGIAMSLIGSLDAGACLLLQQHFDPGASLDLIEAERATTVHAWAHQHKALGEHPGAAERALGSIRRIDPASPLAVYAEVGPNPWGLQGSYGLSETFTIFATHPTEASEALRQGTSGRPLPGNQLRIVDPGSGTPLPQGRPGEIAVKGPTLMRGYYKRPPESFLDAEGFFRTGDGGFVDSDGNLHWTGRLSGLIKTGGANVSPVEIEDLLRSYAPLKAAVALGIPHPTLDEALVLCAVRRDDAPHLDEATVRAHLRERLAAYKVPRRVLFFRADELSYTANQKIQAAPLRERALERLRAEGAGIAGYVYAES